MTTHAAITSPAERPEWDYRWEAWVAKGGKQDRKTETRAFVFAVILGACLAFWAALLLVG